MSYEGRGKNNTPDEDPPHNETNRGVDPKFLGIRSILCVSTCRVSEAFVFA